MDYDPRSGSAAAGGSDPTYLDPIATSAQPTGGHTYRCRQLTFCLPQMIHAERALALADTPQHARQLARMEKCCDSAWFLQHEESLHVRVAASRCHVRWCPICQRSRRNIIVPGISAWIGTQPEAKFLTLTLKHRPGPLQEQIDRLYDCFRRLRRLKFFSAACRGGVWFFQITKSKADRCWHPHLHCLIDSAWMDHSALVTHWKYITGDSHIVDIRPVRDSDATAAYVARYATSPCELMHLGDPDKVEAVAALGDRRICGTWGNALGIPLRPAKTEDWYKWRYVVGYFAATTRQASETIYKKLIRAWTTGLPMRESIWLDQQPAALEKSLSIIQPETYRQLAFCFDSNPRPPEEP
jgi:hypothetical protein